MSHEKRKISLRYWLMGRGYYNALEAMEFASQFHKGLRKDGITPEIDHQISIAHFIRSISQSLLYPEETIITAFLHDVREDYNVSNDEIKNKFGEHIADTVNRLTKIYRNENRNIETIFENIALCPIASIVKGGDRIHNHHTMVGVFTIEKQKLYIEETKKFFFPMLKNARRNFPRQEPAYENIKFFLQSQTNMVENIILATENNTE